METWENHVKKQNMLGSISIWMSDMETCGLSKFNLTKSDFLYDEFCWNNCLSQASGFIQKTL